MPSTDHTAQGRGADQEQKAKAAHLKDYQLVAPTSEGFPEELSPSREVPRLCLHAAPGQQGGGVAGRGLHH